MKSQVFKIVIIPSSLLIICNCLGLLLVGLAQDFVPDIPDGKLQPTDTIVDRPIVEVPDIKPPPPRLILDSLKVSERSTDSQLEQYVSESFDSRLVSRICG